MNASINSQSKNKYTFGGVYYFGGDEQNPRQKGHNSNPEVFWLRLGYFDFPIFSFFEKMEFSFSKNISILGTKNRAVT